MQDFCARHGGFTWDAAEEISGLDRDGDGEILKRSSDLGEVLRYDGRDTRRAYSALQLAFASASTNNKDLLLVTLSFYWPTSGIAYPHFDDSGGTGRSCGPVLGPARCRHLLDCWLAGDPEHLARAPDGCPPLWDASTPPHAGPP